MVKVVDLKTKPQKKEQHYKFTMIEQNAKEPQIRDHSVDSESTLAKFAKRPIGLNSHSITPQMNLRKKTTESLVGKARKILVGKTMFPKKVLKLLLIVME